MALRGGSFALRFEGPATKFVSPLMNARATSNILSSKFKLGGDASAVPGPVGWTVLAETGAAVRIECCLVHASEDCLLMVTARRIIENYRHLGVKQRRHSGKHLRLILTNFAPAHFCVVVDGSSGSAQVPTKERCPDSERGGSLACPDGSNDPADRQRGTKLGGTDVEFFTESLDSLSLPTTPSLPESRGLACQAVWRNKFDVVVADWTGHY